MIFILSGWLVVTLAQLLTVHHGSGFFLCSGTELACFETESSTSVADDKFFQLAGKIGGDSLFGRRPCLGDNVLFCQAGRHRFSLDGLSDWAAGPYGGMAGWGAICPAPGPHLIPRRSTTRCRAFVQPHWIITRER